MQAWRLDVNQTKPDVHRQHARMRDVSRAGLFAAVSAALMLVVVSASALIRARGAAGFDVQPERTAHRIAASTVALLVIALAVLAWRVPRLRRVAAAAFVLMIALSAVGWITGTTPPPPAAFFNQFGGLALTAMLAWSWTRASWAAGPAADAPLAATAIVLGGAQAAFGAGIAAFAAAPPPAVLIAHAAFGLAAAALVAALRHPAFVACAAFAAAAGVFTTLPGTHALAPVAHALSAALVLSAAAAAHGRSHA
jgi:hypothetical protein